MYRPLGLPPSGGRLSSGKILRSFGSRSSFTGEYSDVIGNFPEDGRPAKGAMNTRVWVGGVEKFFEFQELLNVC